MFTKEDYINYFEIIQKKEKEALNFYTGILPLIEDKRVLWVLSSILKDEERHVSLASELLSLIRAE